MNYIKFLFVLASVGCAFCDVSLLDPCPHRDSDCISLNTEKFLDKTSAGIPEYDIQPIDPLPLRHVEYADPGSDVVMHFKDIKITGFKKLRISNFTMLTDTKLVTLQARINANIDSDLTVELKQVKKFLSGTYNAKANNYYLTATYNYELVPNDKGVVFYEVGPETITCEPTEAPTVTLDPGFADTISKDVDAEARRADYELRAPEIRKKAVCEILTAGYAVAIHNIRATAKILPKTAFFTDV